MDSAYTAVISLEQLTDGSSVYFAYHPDLPGCMSDGESPEEARANLDQARQVCLEYLRQNNLPIPEPRALFGRRTVLPRPADQEISQPDRCLMHEFVFEPA